jgi:hypothetical protein
MEEQPPVEQDDLARRIHSDLIDNFDEELEMERDDVDVLGVAADGQLLRRNEERQRRLAYFHELFVSRASSSSFRIGWSVASTSW